MGYSPWGCKESDTTEQLHFLRVGAVEVGKVSDSGSILKIKLPIKSCGLSNWETAAGFY